MMSDPRDESEGPYLPRVRVPREDQRVTAARRLLVVDRLMIDEDSRGRRRRLARQCREAFSILPRVFAPDERQRVVDDKRLVDERANLRLGQRGFELFRRVVRRPRIGAPVVVSVDEVEPVTILDPAKDRERLAHLPARRSFVDDIASQDHEIRVFRVETFHKAPQTRRVRRQTVVKVGKKDDLVPLRAERNPRFHAILRPFHVADIDVSVRENRRREDDRSDAPAIDEIPKRRVLLIPPSASKDAPQRREEEEKDGQMQERDERAGAVPRDGFPRDEEKEPRRDRVDEPPRRSRRVIPRCGDGAAPEIDAYSDEEKKRKNQPKKTPEGEHERFRLID